MARLSARGLARTLLIVRALDQELIEKTHLDWCEVYGQAVCERTGQDAADGEGPGPRVDRENSP
jgi:hypothetical protein